MLRKPRKPMAKGFISFPMLVLAFFATAGMARSAQSEEQAPGENQTPVESETQPEVQKAELQSAAEILGDSPTFEQVQKLFESRYDGWLANIMAQEEDDDAEWGSLPGAEFSPYFQKFALDHHVDAMGWVLDNAWSSSMPAAELRELKLHCIQSLAKLVDQNEEHLRTVAYALMYDQDPESAISWNTADQILRELYIGVDAEDKENQAFLLYARYSVQDSRPGKKGEVLAIQILKTLAKDYPDTRSGGRAAGMLFNKQYLQVGMRAPNFIGKDVDGNPISLRNYKGKVVYLVFWGFW